MMELLMQQPFYKRLNLGDWLRYDSYAEFDGNSLKLKYYKP